MVTQRIVFGALLLACTPLCVHALDVRPHIVVAFEIKAPAFERNLPERAAAQENIGRELAKRIEQHIGVIDWTVTPRDQQARLGTLVLRLEEEPNTAPNPRIVVNWYGHEENKPPHALGIPAIEVYEPTNPNWDTNSRRLFETRVTSKLLEAINSEEFYDTLFKSFVRGLPISTTASAQPGTQIVDIPLHWRDMLLASTSEIIVRFSKQTGSTVEKGDLHLTPVESQTFEADTTTHAISTRLRGRVQSTDFGLDETNLATKWKDVLPDLLRNATVNCLLYKYQQADADTVADLDLGPNN
jgi:hypothetical protein